MFASRVFQEIKRLELRADQIAYEAVADFAGARCQCSFMSWTLSPEQLIQWAEIQHVRLLALSPSLFHAVAQWLPANIYGDNDMPSAQVLDWRRKRAETLVSGIEIESVVYYHNDDHRYRHPDGTTITIMSNLRKNVDVERDESYLNMVDVMITLDENLSIKRIYCDG